MKENRDKAYAKKTSSPNINISSEVLERIIKNKKERELDQERHFLFAKILFLGIVIIALLLILGIRYFILKNN
jgi:RNA polymerase-interacting CarD/CdnL/TRCF family regulator